MPIIRATRALCLLRINLQICRTPYISWCCIVLAETNDTRLGPDTASCEDSPYFRRVDTHSPPTTDTWPTRRKLRPSARTGRRTLRRPGQMKPEASPFDISRQHDVGLGWNRPTPQLSDVGARHLSRPSTLGVKLRDMADDGPAKTSLIELTVGYVCGYSGTSDVQDRPMR